MILNDCVLTLEEKWNEFVKLYFNIFDTSGACIMQGCSESFSGLLLVAMVLLGDWGLGVFTPVSSSSRLKSWIKLLEKQKHVLKNDSALS